jgi:hypothetical protein
MRDSSEYWIGGNPLGGDRWSYARFGTVLDDVATRQALFRMHGRYVRQWNDIELDSKRSLLEHTQQVHGAKVLTAGDRFVLHGRSGSWSHWILEILYSPGFREFYPWTLERNTLRSLADVRSVHLHWSGVAGKHSEGGWKRSSPHQQTMHPVGPSRPGSGAGSRYRTSEPMAQRKSGGTCGRLHWYADVFRVDKRAHPATASKLVRDEGQRLGPLHFLSGKTLARAEVVAGDSLVHGDCDGNLHSDDLPQ